LPEANALRLGPAYDPGPKTRAGVATYRKRTIIATRPRLRPPARRPGRALQLAGSERSLRLAGQLKPVTPCRKCMIATCGGAGASYTRMYYVCLRIGQRYSHCERAPSQERRASAPRGQRIVMPKEVRVLAAIEHRQERRASARRGSQNRICKCNAMNFGVRVSRPECTPRGAYAPRSWLHSAGSPEKTTAAVQQTQRSQERRASARRGFPNRICKCNAMNFRVSRSYAECTPRGLTPPALGRCTTSVRRENGAFCAAQTHVHKSGGREPAVAFRTASASAVR
jgi:hypothetical protein